MNVFSDIITNSISKLIKERKEQDIPVSPLLMLTSFFEKISKEKIRGNELKNVTFRECS